MIVNRKVCACMCVYPSGILARLSKAQMNHGALSGKVSWSKEDLIYLTKWKGLAVYPGERMLPA